jgi:redox-sensitive bicupin YhaK (pirin superfamily)
MTMATKEAELELVLRAREAVLPGGLGVRRALPQARRRMVGPFVFVDQMGPATLEADQEITVLPHPHIGLSTVTYLFEGEGEHRDSLGTVQRILPGEVNWMTAGRGIAHSERMRAGASGRVFGVQIWVALPRAMEEATPRFEHYGAEAVHVLEEGGVSTRLIAGTLFGARSAVRVSSPLFYAEARTEAGSVLRLPAEHAERALFVVEGAVTVGAKALSSGDMAVFHAGGEVRCHSDVPCRLLLLGGEPLDGPRHIVWNFVSSSRDRIDQAASDWRAQRFDRVPGETSYIPLPEDGGAPVNYP